METYQNWTKFELAKLLLKVRAPDGILQLHLQNTSTHDDELTHKAVQRVLQIMWEILQSDKDFMKVKQKLLCP